MLARQIPALAIAGLFSGCAGSSDATPDITAESESPYEQGEDGAAEGEVLTGAYIRVGTLRGPTGMGMASLMDRAEEGFTDNLYAFTVAGAPEEITAGLISGSLDIAAIPANLASVLYNRTDGEVMMIAVNTLGVLFVLDSTGEISSIEDLRGKTINATGQGAIPEYALEHILRGNGMEPGIDVEIVYKTEHSELAALMVSGDASIGMLPQPFVTTVTMQNSDISIALDLTAEWEAVNPGFGLVQGSIVVRTEFLERNPDAVELFLRDHAESVAYVNSNPEEAAQLMERFDIIPAAVALGAIPNSSIVHIDGVQMRLLVDAFLQVMYEANPQSVGGSTPDEKFFFIR